MSVLLGIKLPPSCNIILESFAGLEYNFIIAPSLQALDFLWRMGLVVDHHIGVVTHVAESVYAVKVFFHRAAKVSQAVDHADIALTPKALREVFEFTHKVICGIIPREMYCP
jgi:hypothetical protein